jgi:peroxiredoxin
VSLGSDEDERDGSSIPPMVEPGQQAPDFELPDQDGRAVELSDFRGEPVVVYFYPKADTPGSQSSNGPTSCGLMIRPMG